MKLRHILPCLMVLLIPSIASAQTKEEESAFVMCKSMIATEGQAEACTDWLKLGACHATYRSRVAEIAKLLSAQDLQKYRIEADKKLKKNCEPMTAAELSLDILKDLTDPEERAARWERIVEWSNKMAPNQHIIIVSELSGDKAFRDLIARKNIRKFVEKCRDETIESLPTPDEQTYLFLKHMEEADPSLMTSDSHAVMLYYELENKQYASAKDRIPHVKFDKLAKGAGKPLQQKIEAVAIPLYGNADFSSVTCFPESSAQSVSSLDLLESFTKDGGDPILLQHVLALKLANCREEEAAKLIAADYAKNFASADHQKLADEALAYLERTLSDRWAAELTKALVTLPKEAADAFAQKYGAKLAKYALTTARNDFARKNAKEALAILEGLEKITPESMRYEVLFELGRAQAMLKKDVQALQTWGMVIEKAGNSPWTEKAYYLSILTLRHGKKSADADQLLRRFSDAMPGSHWLKEL